MQAETETDGAPGRDGGQPGFQEPARPLSPGQPSVISGLAATAQTRRRELRTRLVIAVIGAAILWLVGNPAYAFCWLVSVIVSQIVDSRVWIPYRDAARRAPLTRGEWIALCASSAQASLIYSGFPVMMWYLWGAPGQIFAALWLCGALLHVTLHMHHERRTFFAAITPHALYFLGLPAISLVTGAEPGRWGAAAILLATVLYLAHLAVAFRQHRAVSQILRSEREYALARQAAAEEASRSKSTFLATMSHEIRTPMNGVLGMAEALENSGLTPEQAHKLRIIRESGDLLLAILNDILDFSKIEANRIEFETAPFRFADIARKVESLHSLKAREKGLDFSVDIAGSCEKPRLGDPHRIVQILHNLVSNAVKFTHRGGVFIRINAGEADRCVIEVADTGIGMTPEQAGRIFDPFAQADTTTARRFGGTGLGLSIAEGLARSMGGSINVVSELGHGSRFIVVLPLPLAEETAEPNETAGQTGARPQGRPARILAAEDNAVNRAVLHALLAPMGHRIDFAEDGEGALDAFSREVYDVVLMDISMPGMDGVEAMRRLRAIEDKRGDGARAPVIAVSAHAMRQQIEDYLAAGFDGYVTKPVTAAKLGSEIDRVLTKRRTAA
ncbi:MAG: ATP-binding protein [Pseudomonadota bacterium]|nr:ATP-binding protein [Pseudomonadota bacterium]